VAGSAEVALSGLLAAALRSSTPLLWTLLGETVTQRAGVINLGVEGQMLVGASTAYGVTLWSGSPWLGLAAGALAGALLSVAHALLCLRFRANQFAAGISVWMIGFGLSAYGGAGLVGQSVQGFAPLSEGVFGAIPLLRALTPTVVLALAATPLFAVLLYWTRFGLALRAAGESADAARIAGLSVGRLRSAAILIGGLASGVGGAALSIDHAQAWAEGMTKGRGLVAVGLVIVARWNPLLALPAALLFGGAEALSLRVQSAGVTVSAHLLHTLPYAACLAVFIVTCLRARAGGGPPASLKAVLER
jgi:general nucleoside transport system permease protein